ncbi:acetyl-CoA acetyltransferase [Thermocatellispora tengchongensis]|uniref:Acetyl-CoA acetyltransferase n=1 Tax=Thermocatellispora tengchongensis TaxID=1073253 RepID=A0A840PJN5_9ACTN|nr:hypothetical protein [Thermocatellispora tengchongensis]MBB5136275.1 acetyl-CoA acetyltransferase [Thermocatellispora tengchongensis]
MSADVRVAGVGMVPFATPSAGKRYEDLAREAIRAALTDAGLALDDVGHAFASYVYGDSACGQAALYEVGMTGVPVVNVNNNCASGSSALWLARQTVAGGETDVALAFGFEQMRRGALVEHWPDRLGPASRYLDRHDDLYGTEEGVPLAAQLFGGAGRAYMEEYGISAEVFGMISVKARRHAAHNPYAVFRDPVTLEEVMASPHIYGPLTRLQCCPPTSGAAAVVLVGAEYARRRGLPATGASPVRPSPPTARRASRATCARSSGTTSPPRPRPWPTSGRASVPRTSPWWSCTTASPPTS